MKSQKFKRISVVASVVAALGVVPLVTAGPASATVKQCTGVVSHAGYVVGPKVKTACGWPHVGGQANALCLQKLMLAGVRYDVANTACQWA
ncbi:hypothetical protein ACGFSG_03065 [Streptomyces sp. NPDC048512]|uniref:hypothetical protein n=1 Tax=unclassified Streptomyces TaxID=2593676 RepID=UPI00371A76DA